MFDFLFLASIWNWMSGNDPEPKVQPKPEPFRLEFGNLPDAYTAGIMTGQAHRIVCVEPGKGIDSGRFWVVPWREVGEVGELEKHGHIIVTPEQVERACYLKEKSRPEPTSFSEIAANPRAFFIQGNARLQYEAKHPEECHQEVLDREARVRECLTIKSDDPSVQAAQGVLQRLLQILHDF